MHKKLDVFRNNFQVIRLVFRLSPSMTILAILSSILIGGANVLTYTISFRVIIDSYQKHANLTFIFALIVFILIFDIVTYFINAIVTNVYLPKIRILVQENIQTKLFTKSKKVDISYLDDPAYLDEFKFVLQNSDTKVYEVFEIFCRVLTLSITSIGTMTLLYQADIIGLFLIVGTVILSFICQTKINIKQYDLDVEVSKLTREGSYFERVFYLVKYAKEVRINNLSKVLTDKYTKVNEDIKEVQKKSAVEIFFYKMLKTFILDKFVVFSLYTGLLLYKTIVLKSLTFGQFVGAYFAVDLLSGSLTFLLYTLPQFQKNNLYLQKYIDFISNTTFDEADNIATRQVDQFFELVFDNVSFKYKNETKYSIKNLSLKIKKGEKIAIVGKNGAGKSTIIKLILRLYTPTEGNIYLNGININEYELSNYRNVFATLFQDFQIYNATLGVNVVMDLFKGGYEQKILETLKVSGFNETMEHKKINIYDELGKEFDENGTLLSGGEEQKLAISRMLYKNADFLIFDESSSALDVRSEKIFNRKLQELFKDKTTLSITHRIHDLDNMDKIYMLNDGIIKEIKNKEQLISDNKILKEM